MAELSTSRINRQFRTLRSKCAALASFSPASTKPAVSVTYGHASRNHTKRNLDECDNPPLAILQSLDKFGARLHLDRAIVENMQLSKRIYEVRDAFKNIVQSSFGSVSEDAPSRSRMHTLASLCARLIGEHIQSEMDASSSENPEVESQEEDAVRSQVMDELYESVLPQHRQ